ncbi:MAG: glycerophosphodiester phosphodiesterase family protein [Bacteroidota bacterium]
MQSIFLGLQFLMWATVASGQIVVGHRGARAELPENTIPSFLAALQAGAEAIEMDLVVSADGKLIVSHEPWFSHKICVDRAGEAIVRRDEKTHNLHQLSAAEIAEYDCGCLGHPDFPRQEAVSLAKPTLAAVVAAVDSAVKSPYGPTFFLEIKSRAGWIPTWQPTLPEFARLLQQEIDALGLAERCVVMSFDRKFLRTMHELVPSLPYLLLTADPQSVDTHVRRLGFVPDYIAPFYRFCNRRKVRQAHDQGIKIAVWTVNEPTKMEKLAQMGVDAIITDDPARGRQILAE